MIAKTMIEDTEAFTYGDAGISGLIKLYGEAQVYNDAWVSGDAWAYYGNDHVLGKD